MSDPQRVDDVVEVAERLQQQIIITFNELGQELPARQYLHVGTPALDCEQFTVSFMGLESGLPDQSSTDPRCPDPSTATYIIDVVRRGPQGTGRQNSPITPDAEKISDFATTQMRDAKALSDACHTFISNHFIPMGSFSVTVSDAEGFHQTVSAEIRVTI